jgi:futalosine hydrolase
VLVPTALEAEALHTEWPLEICGFGLAAAGVGAMAAIVRHHPAALVLVGLAGTYDTERAPLESVVTPGRVRCVGIGAGGRTAAELGFAASDELPLAGGDVLALSVTEASGSQEQAAGRLRAHPDALIEDMEGYAVALAAMHTGISCTMVRGVSNQAGVRDRAHWSVDAALAAVQRTLDSMAGR